MLPGSKSVVPTAKDINDLLAVLPRLQVLLIGVNETGIEPEDEDEYKGSMPKALIKSCENLAPAFLKGLIRKGCPVSQLTTLKLWDCHLDGALLVKAFVAHKHSLDEVSLRLVKLKAGKKAMRWHEIFLALSQLDLDELSLHQLSESNAQACVVLCEKSKDDEDRWISHDTDEGIRYRENCDVGQTGFAKFRRYFAYFTESCVELGLRRMRKSQDLELYPSYYQ